MKLNSYQFKHNKLNVDLAGYVYTIDLINTIRHLGDNKVIEIDFTTLGWIDTRHCASIGAAIEHKGKDRVRFKTNNSRVCQAIQRVGFHEYLDQPPLPDYFDNTISYCKFDSSDREQGFLDYLNRQLKFKSLPKMSNQAYRKFTTSLSEILDNASSHSETDGYICVCGQQFPKLNTLGISICDLGIGIASKVKREINPRFMTEQAIDWAVTEGNSTRKTGPNGFGLSDILEFLKLNKGILRIITNDGFWFRTSNFKYFHKLPIGFDGTIIDIEIRTDDQSQYILTSELPRK